MQKSSHPADSPDTKQVAIFQHPAWQPLGDRLAMWITWDTGSRSWWFVCTFERTLMPARHDSAGIGQTVGI